MSKQKPVGLVKKVAIGLLAAGLLVVFVYVFVVRPLQIRYQKQQFAKAEASLDQLYNQIIAKVGKPDQHKKWGNCGYVSQVYIRGPRSCDVGFSILFQNQNFNASNTLMKRVASLIGDGKTSDHLGRNNIQAFVSISQERGDQIFYQNINNLSGLSCGAGYTYPLGRAFDGLVITTNENLQIEVSCGGPAMAEFYPVKN